jgi:hypothetical protein
MLLAVDIETSSCVQQPQAETVAGSADLRKLFRTCLHSLRMQGLGCILCVGA